MLMRVNKNRKVVDQKTKTVTLLSPLRAKANYSLVITLDEFVTMTTTLSISTSSHVIFCKYQNFDYICFKDINIAFVSL